MARKKSIRISPDDERLLRMMYYEARVPSDQYSKRPGFLRRFTAVWNEATGRSDSSEELMHWIVTRRKRPVGRPGRLEAIGENHKKMSSLGQHMLSVDQWDALHDIYRELNVGSDNFVFDADLRIRLVSMFLDKTGVHMSETFLVAALISRRKEGMLRPLGADLDDDIRDIGFGDIDLIAS